MNKICRITKATLAWCGAHKSEIATGAGLVAEAGAIALACKATLKSKKDFDIHKEKLQELKRELDSIDDRLAIYEEADDRGDLSEIEKEGWQDTRNEFEVKNDEIKKEIRHVRVQIAKNYIWTGLVFVASGALFIFSCKNGRKELRKATAALAAETAALKLERDRMKKILTEDQYNEIVYGIKPSVKNEGGGQQYQIIDNVVPNSTEKDYIDNKDLCCIANQIVASKYAFIFDRNSSQWDSHWDYTRLTIPRLVDYCVEEIANEGYITLNRIRKNFGLKAIEGGEDVGILYGPDVFDDIAHLFETFEICEKNGDEPKFLVDPQCEYIRGRLHEGIMRAM